MLWTAADVTISRHETIFWLSRFELAKDSRERPKSIRKMIPTRRLPASRFLFLSLISALILNTTYAQQPADRPIDYESFDARSTLTSASHTAKGARAYASGAMQQLGGSFSRSLFDLSGPITGPRAGDAETIARDYLHREITAFQTKAASPFDLPLV